MKTYEDLSFCYVLFVFEAIGGSKAYWEAFEPLALDTLANGGFSATGCGAQGARSSLDSANGSPCVLRLSSRAARPAVDLRHCLWCRWWGDGSPSEGQRARGAAEGHATWIRSVSKGILKLFRPETAWKMNENDVEVGEGRDFAGERCRGL